MKPVEQKVIKRDTGDCMAACLASILEMPLDDVPNFHGDGAKNWKDQYNDWLKPRNLQMCITGTKNIDWPYGYYIVSVKSACFEGSLHAVVAERKDWNDYVKIVWNPNPEDKRGCEIPYEEWVFADFLTVLDPRLTNGKEAEHGSK